MWPSIPKYESDFWKSKKIPISKFHKEFSSMNASTHVEIKSEFFSVKKLLHSTTYAGVWWTSWQPCFIIRPRSGCVLCYRDVCLSVRLSVCHTHSRSYLLNYESEPHETLCVGSYPVQLQEYEENFLNFLPIFFF